MEALAGYGSSGSDAEEEEVPRAAPKAHAAPPPAAPAAPGGKRVVQFKVPLRVDALDADDAEEEREAKRRRAAPAAPAAGSGLFAFLPPPIHAELGSGGDGFGGGGGKLDLGGGSDAAAHAAPAQRPAAPPAAPRRVDAAPPAPAMHPSMMFMLQPGSASTPAEAMGWSVEAPEASAAASAAALAGGAEGPDAMLFHALEAERAAAARRNPRGGPALAPPAVLEVSAAQLTAGRDKLVATKSLTGLAFGPEYEAKLRAEAGMKPADSARRKHQIGSLLHDAKMREIEMLEGRLTAMKSKRETQAKYGW